MKIDKNEIYKDIAELLSYPEKPKSFNTVKNWASKDPKLLNLLINATLLHNADYKNTEDIKELLEIDSKLKESGMSREHLNGLLDAVKVCKES